MSARQFVAEFALLLAAAALLLAVLIVGAK